MSTVTRKCGDGAATTRPVNAQTWFAVMDELRRNSFPERAGNMENKTRKALLQAATELFAKYGRYNISIRQIAAYAKVNLAAINYHFGSKDGLFYAVCLNYLRSIINRRVALLNELEADRCGPLSAEKIVEAYVRPTIEMHARKDSMERLISRMISQEITETEEQFYTLAREVAYPGIQRFMDSLRKIFPDGEEDDLMCGFLIVVSATQHLIGEIDVFSGVCRINLSDKKLENLIRKVIAFGSAGMRGLVTPAHGAERVRRRAGAPAVVP